jgi:peptide-methionine (S)-S-oxide reductase
MIRTRSLTVGVTALVVLLIAAAQVRADAMHPSNAAPAAEKIVLAGGCFWGMEAVFESLKGVSSAVAGYAGGSKATAHYDVVENGDTGHAESVEITFDPHQISLDQLLSVFFFVAHDPTELNRQGPDVGTQYRSVIFYENEAQRAAAAAFIRRLETAKTFSAPIVTQVVALPGFYPAEEYHQHFVTRNPYYPYVVFNDKPKLEKLRKQYPQLVKSGS